MSKKKQKKQLKKYEVTISREVMHRAVVEVEAESEDVAKQMAENIADAPRSGYWMEDHVVSQSFRVKELS